MMVFTQVGLQSRVSGETTGEKEMCNELIEADYGS